MVCDAFVEATILQVVGRFYGEFSRVFHDCLGMIDLHGVDSVTEGRDRSRRVGSI